MKKIILTLSLIVSSIFAMANDSVYFLEGNQLIPINESDIRVSKEVLNIIREGEYIFVTVNYTFYNPSKEKTILVGFEASAPGGADVETFPKNGGHPYMKSFNVIMNDQIVPHKVAIVDKKNYFIQGKIAAKTVKQVTNTPEYKECPECANFYYVYYFNATFKKGKNKLIHTYKFDTSNSVMTRYEIDYILTAANRWNNHQIDDFTLNIHMGKGELFRISKTFFTDKTQWQIDDGVMVDKKGSYSDIEDKGELRIITYTGGVHFKAQNFHPKGEIRLYSLFSDNEKEFDYTKDTLPSSIYTGRPLQSDDPFSLLPPFFAKDKKSYKILRNLPFAIRGYIFKTSFIQKYYEKQPWYRPNPNYKSAGREDLTEKEQQWLANVDYIGLRFDR